jgi:hypothetical protein
MRRTARRSAWRVRIEKNTSTRFSHEHEVGVKCRVIRGWRLSQARPGGAVGGVVVDHHVQLPARIGDGDLAQEGRKLLFAVPLMAGVGRALSVSTRRRSGSGRFEPDRPGAALPTGHVILVRGRPLPTPCRGPGRSAEGQQTVSNDRVSEPFPVAGGWQVGLNTPTSAR